MFGFNATPLCMGIIVYWKPQFEIRSIMMYVVVYVQMRREPQGRAHALQKARLKPRHFARANFLAGSEKHHPPYSLKTNLCIQFPTPCLKVRPTTSFCCVDVFLVRNVLFQKAFVRKNLASHHYVVCCFKPSPAYGQSAQETLAVLFNLWENQTFVEPPMSPTRPKRVLQKALDGNWDML